MNLIHPSRAALARYADTPTPARSHRVRRHLEGCARCRVEVGFVRSLAALDDSNGPVAGARLEQAIRQRLDAGERVILPTGTLPGAARDRQWGAVAAAAAVLIVAILLRPDAQLTAGDVGGTLTFGASGILFGRSIPVEYRSGALLGGGDRVVLRARYRRPGDEAYNLDSRQVRAAVLVRGDDGVFRGAIVVPDSVVLGRFAVESADGTKVDHNDRELWSLHQRTPEGSPAFDALAQEASDLYGENFERVLSVTRELARLYPEDPRAWSSVRGLEDFMLGRAYADSVRGEHRGRLLALHERYAGQADLPLDIAFGMDGYAIGVSDGADTVVRRIARYWRSRVTSDPQRHRVTDMFRVFAAGDSVRRDTARADALYEALWPEIGWRVPFLATNAWAWVSAARDADAMLRWADRIVARRPSAASYYFGKAAELPAIRNAALQRLRAHLRPNPALVDSLRPLEMTTGEWDREQRLAVAAIHFAMGEALLADGRVQGGLDTLDLAAETVWHRDVLISTARAHLHAGDSTGAARYMARIAVDPNSSREARDSLRAIVRSTVPDSRWDSLEVEARAMMREQFLEQGISRALPESVRLVDSDGRATTLQALTRGRPAIVTFWSRHCGPSRRKLAELNELAGRAAEQGGVLIAITPEEPSESLRAELRSLGVTVPVYHDRWAEAKRAFRQYATPEYHVVDAEGRHRFARSNADWVTPQLAVLSTRRTM